MVLAWYWLASMPSDIGRRPNGVVILAVSISLHLSIGKRKTLTQTVPKTLDSDSGKCDSLAAYTEKGFHDGDVRGPFSFPDFAPLNTNPDSCQDSLVFSKENFSTNVGSSASTNFRNSEPNTPSATILTSLAVTV